jgi:hypothetical protein
MGNTFDFSDNKKLAHLAWQVVMTVAIVYTAFEAPLSFIMKSSIKESHAWWDVFFTSLFGADLINNFRNRNIGEDDQVISIKNWGKETPPYHKSIWFPVDILASIPFDLFAYLLGAGPSMLLLRYLRMARVIRIGKLFGYLGSVTIPKQLRIGIIVSLSLIIIHFIACGWMAFNPEPNSDPVSFYIKCLYWAVTTLTTIGYGDITPSGNISRIYTMVIMILGVGTYGVVIGTVSKMIVQAERHKEEKKEKFNELTMFLKHYKVPFALQKQVFSFYGHLLDKKLFDGEAKIINDLPQALQNELEIYKKIKLIRNAPIFQGCSIPCLKMIADHLKQEVYSPNKYIMQKGDRGREMYIIGHGEIEVLVGDKVVANLQQGQYFGEIALLEETTRNADIKSKSYCDLYVFDKEDFVNVVNKFPDLHDKFTSLYQRRAYDKKTNKKAS